MSNFEALKLYEVVVEEVIADSRQDFEDSGIDESTLQELKKLWCDKLNQFNVCDFSWDEDVERSHLSEHVSICGPAIKADALQLGGNLDLPVMSNYSPPVSLQNSDVPDESYSMSIEIPAVKQESEELCLDKPSNQSDGSLELTFISSPTAAAQLLQRVEKQVDGPGISNDDEDDDDVLNDSDDINSDLDDELDSDKSDEDEGDQEGQIMLCLYDKVQRVKNKWKCNLKEGVANIDGKDFVFQRATGESEW